MGNIASLKHCIVKKSEHHPPLTGPAVPQYLPPDSLEGIPDGIMIHPHLQTNICMTNMYSCHLSRAFQLLTFSLLQINISCLPHSTAEKRAIAGNFSVRLMLLHSYLSGGMYGQ